MKYRRVEREPADQHVGQLLRAEGRGEDVSLPAVAAQRAGDWTKYGEELKKLGEALERASASPPKR